MSESSDVTPAADSPGFAAAPGRPDPKGTRLVRELKHARGMLACRFDRAGQRVFAGAQDEFVHRWDLSELPLVDPVLAAKSATKKSKEPPPESGPDVPKTTLAGHESWIQAMALSADGARLVTGDYVGRLLVWQMPGDEGQPLHSIDAHAGSIRAVSISPDGELVASAGNDGCVRVWSVKDGQQRLQLDGHGCHVYHTAFHPDGKSLVSADLKGVLRHWELSSGKLLRQLDASALWKYSEQYTVDVGGVRGMAFNADGSRLACAGAVGEKGIAHSGNARVLLFDWDSGKLIRTFRPEKEVIATAWGVRFHPDGYLVGSGGSRTGGFLWFWHGDAETEFHQIPFTTRGPGFDLDLAADGQTLAVAHYDGAVRLYQMPLAPEEASG